ncbi:MAG: hypothetical protein UT48_C0023G0013 [Parcubacteria group bacterium GW2011_GWE2_39_37]|nr:MAG: hypothetical protein UT48_C0023G0013 [Parcubacteria group bacterium GW2011_GWE2_39_37]
MKTRFSIIVALAALMLSITAVANANPTGNNVNTDQAVYGSNSITGNVALAAPDIGQNGLLISASKEENGALLKANFKDTNTADGISYGIVANSTLNGTYVDIALNVSGLNTNTIAENATIPPNMNGALANNDPPVNTSTLLLCLNATNGNPAGIAANSGPNNIDQNGNNKVNVENGNEPKKKVSLAANILSDNGAGANGKLQVANIGGSVSVNGGTSAVVTG